MKRLKVYLHTADDESTLITEYDPGYLETWERRTPLGTLYSQWKDARSNNLPAPMAGDFHAWGEGILRADVRSEYPFHYKLVSTGDHAAIASLQLIYKTESRVIQQQFFDDLLCVKETMKPLYQSVMHRSVADDESTEMAFTRVLLPVLGDNRKTAMIYSTTRRIGAEPAIYITEML